MFAIGFLVVTLMLKVAVPILPGEFQAPRTTREGALTAAPDDGIVVVVVMTPPRYSVSEYLSTPETLGPQELVYGHVREAPGPAASHQNVVGNLYTALRTHLSESGAGRVWLSPIDVVLDSQRGLVVQPDLIVVAKDRLHIVTDRVWGAPDLTIEVLSPQPRIGEVAERIGWFARYGVRECWLVRQTPADVEVIVFGAGDVIGRRVFAGAGRIESVVLPGSCIAPSDVLTLW